MYFTDYRKEHAIQDPMHRDFGAPSATPHQTTRIGSWRALWYDGPLATLCRILRHNTELGVGGRGERSRRLRGNRLMCSLTAATSGDDTCVALLWA
jgi:hypothetical protein